jgi:hypothetical protein
MMAKVFPELRTVLCETAAQSIKHFDRDPLGVGGGPYQDRRHSADQNGCGNSLCTVSSDVPCHFPSASGVTYKSDIFEIKFLNDRCQVVGVPIHVVPGPGLAGPAMAAAGVRNHAETILGEEQQLAVSCIGTQRPSV